MQPNALWNFLNSSFFIAVITFVAAMVAYWLYRKRNKDLKKDAANILLLEIQNAERQIKSAKKIAQKLRGLADDVYLMPTESWGKYKYLFVRDFDRDEWDTISEFYEQCSAYDEAVTYTRSFFSKSEDQIRVNMQRITADFLLKYTKEEDAVKRQKILEEASKFQSEYLNHPDLTVYEPNKPANDGKAALESINGNLSQSSLGTKLKKLAKVKQ